MAQSTWDLALRILEYIGVVEDDEHHGGILSVEDLVEALDEPPKAVENELRRLHAGGYILGKLDGGMAEYDTFVAGPGLSDLGARMIGKWPPNDPYEVLLQLLDERIQGASSCDERSRWERIREGLIDIGKSGAGGLVVELGKAVAGL